MKTLTDPDRFKVNFVPVDATVDALGNLPKPSPAPGRYAPRLIPQEAVTYRIRAAVVEVKESPGDRDIHLVIKDPATGAKDPEDKVESMIVEFVDVSCPGVKESNKKEEMAKARKDFEEKCTNATSSFKHLAGNAVITGVAFFDRIHNQRGVAPNGIELHPVLSFSTTNCHVKKAEGEAQG